MSAPGTAFWNVMMFLVHVVSADLVRYRKPNESPCTLYNLQEVKTEEVSDDGG